MSGYAKRYRSGGGAHMARAFDAGTSVRAHFPYGTFTAVDCPDCSALAGAKCISKYGKVKAQVHASRRRIAIRKYYAGKEAKETSL